MELKLQELLPHASYINLIDWDDEVYDIETDLFDKFPDEGIEFRGTLGYLLETPIDFRMRLTKATTVSDILSRIQEAYQESSENGLEEYYPYDLIVISLMINLEEKTIETTFLETR